MALSKNEWGAGDTEFSKFPTSFRRKSGRLERDLSAASSSSRINGLRLKERLAKIIWGQLLFGLVKKQLVVSCTC